jgi:predicted Zn finger-like uncharacterized protein
MPKEILCPICGATYNLGEDQLGKKVRCKKCEHPFTAGGKEHEKKNDPDEDDDDRVTTGAKGGKKGKKGRDEPAPKTKSLEEQARKKTAPPPKTPVTSIVLGSIGFVVLVGCCGGGGWACYKIKQSWNRAAANAQNNPPHQNPWVNPNPGPIGNPGVPQKPAPANLDEALAALHDADIARRREGTNWFVRNPVNDGQKAAASKALDPLLHDQDDQVRGNAAQAIRTWGTTENVPSLVRCLETKDRSTWESAVDSLAQLKDARGLPALAALLEDGGMRNKAIEGFRVWGKTAEAELLKYAFFPDDYVRGNVQTILRINYATPDTTLVSQALVDLKSADQRRCDKALEWLGPNPPEDTRRAALARGDAKQRQTVAQALTPFIRENNDVTRSTAFRALKIWATKDNVVPLVDFLVDKVTDNPRWRWDQQCQAAIQILGELADERATKAIILYLGQYGNVPVEALKSIGPKAEPDVIKCFDDPNNAIREGARKVLADRGVKAPVILTQVIADLKDPDDNRRNYAADYLQKIPVEASRKVEVSKALNNLLDSSNAGTRDIGLRLMKTWGTKENIPALVARVEDPAFNPQTLSQCSAAMQALADIGDEQGVWPIAKHLSNTFQRGNAEAAIKKFGPLAEKEAMPHLKDADPAERQRAWIVLGAVATKASVPELEPLAKKETDRNAQIAATNALRLIQARP